MVRSGLFPNDTSPRRPGHIHDHFLNYVNNDDEDISFEIRDRTNFPFINRLSSMSTHRQIELDLSLLSAISSIFNYSHPAPVPLYIILKTRVLPRSK